jgi:hypothetical protein
MAARAVLALVLLAALIAPASAATRECPVPVPPEGPSHTKYGPRAEGRYCDGEVTSPHGGRLRLLSIMGSAASALPAAPPLTLRLLGGAQRLPTQIFSIEGLPLQATRNYRFDASLRASELPLRIGGEAALWQLSQELPPSHVGWTAWTQVPGEERIYWPLSLGDGATSGVRIILRSSIVVAVLRVKVHEPTGQTGKQNIQMLFPPNEPIPYDLPPGPPGIVTIDVLAEGANGVSSETLSFQVQRP